MSELIQVHTIVCGWQSFICFIKKPESLKFCFSKVSPTNLMWYILMYVNVNICLYIYIYIYVNISLLIFMLICLQLCWCFMNTHMYLCTSERGQASTECVRRCTCACMWRYMRVQKNMENLKRQSVCIWNNQTESVCSCVHECVCVSVGQQLWKPKLI